MIYLLPNQITLITSKKMFTIKLLILAIFNSYIMIKLSAL